MEQLTKLSHDYLTVAIKELRDNRVMDELRNIPTRLAWASPKVENTH